MMRISAQIPLRGRLLIQLAVNYLILTAMGLLMQMTIVQTLLLGLQLEMMVVHSRFNSDSKMFVYLAQMAQICSILPSNLNGS